MFDLTIQHHIHRIHNNINPFAMGCTAMNPRTNFFLGMACATAFPPIFPMFSPFYMPYQMPLFAYSPVISNFGFPYRSYNNPFLAVNGVYNYNSMSTYNQNRFNYSGFGFLSTPAVNNFAYNRNAFAFGKSSANLFQYSKPEKSYNAEIKSHNTQNPITYPGSSKLKPGLLKGNLVGKEAVITQLCKKYGVDLALVVSIIGLESGFGTSNLAKHNNFMGYRAAGDCGKNSKGFGYFSTPEKGLEVAIRNLSKYPERYASVKKADMNNIDAIGRIYCEGTTYSSAIKDLYNTTVRGYLA